MWSFSQTKSYFTDLTRSNSTTTTSCFFIETRWSPRTRMLTRMLKITMLKYRLWYEMKMSMLKPIVKQWNNVIAPDLFSLRDSSTGVATQWRAASSAFQDMEAMRDERITHEMSCVGNHMRRCNKIKCMDQQTRKYRKCVETSCSGTKHARCLHGTGVAKLRMGGWHHHIRHTCAGRRPAILQKRQA